LKLIELKKQVWQANLDLVKYGLITLAFGNVSGIDRDKDLVVIKPSGFSYEEMKPEDMVVVDLEGKIVDSRLNPSSDTPTHLELYRAFEQIGGVTHTHSEYATIFAQACREIPCYGTTHADYFKGNVPVTRFMSKEEVQEDYEENTGKVIVERFADLEPLEMPAVLVAGHGAFAWGKTPSESVENSLILEKVAKMALGTLQLNPECDSIPKCLLQKHYQRKHGPNAYYGQDKKGAKK
jgi:L-ribulose-5-phosphate 4-epimerase